MALLAAAVSHTPEGEEVLRGARMRMARKPSAVARELLKNFPKGKRRRKRKRKDGQGENGGAPEGESKPKAKARRRRSRKRAAKKAAAKKAGDDDSDAGEVDLAGAEGDAVPVGAPDE